MSPYGHPVQKANRARPIVIANDEINPAMWNPRLAIVRRSKVRATRPHRLRAIGELNRIIRQGLSRPYAGSGAEGVVQWPTTALP
jgi:hypothetical protein